MELNLLMAEILRHKREIYAFLDCQDPEKIARGRLEIPARLLNNELKPYILGSAAGMLRDYHVDFRGGFLLLAGEAELRQLGPLSLSYKLKIQEFRFDASGHRLTGTFEERADARGNLAQKIAVKTALMGGTLLGLGVRLAKPEGVHVDGNNLMADLDRMPFANKIPEKLTLSLAGIQDGILALDFHLE